MGNLRMLCKVLKLKYVTRAYFKNVKFILKKYIKIYDIVLMA